jgi:hypothetical protein
MAQQPNNHSESHQNDAHFGRSSFFDVFNFLGSENNSFSIKIHHPYFIKDS